MTVITPLSTWKRVVLRLTLWGFRYTALRFVAGLRFIHFAHWSIVSPEAFAKANPTDEVARHYLLFATNYNGPWDQYIDAFSLVPQVRRGINWLWWSSLGFPSAWPVRAFKRYIRYFEYPVDAYYNAYPGASIRDIEAALALRVALRRFERSSPQRDLRNAIAAFDAVHADLLGGATRGRAPSSANAIPRGLQL